MDDLVETDAARVRAYAAIGLAVLGLVLAGGLGYLARLLAGGSGFGGVLYGILFATGIALAIAYKNFFIFGVFTVFGFALVSAFDEWMAKRELPRNDS
jgi:hypothetical protein